jgi:hypothetical protein
MQVFLLERGGFCVYFRGTDFQYTNCFEEGVDETLRLAGAVVLDCSAWFHGDVGSGCRSGSC